MMKIKIICLFVLLTFLSCEYKSEQNNVDASLNKVVEKFPQALKRGNNFLFEKSIKNGKYNFEILLYSEPDTVSDPQKMIVIINSKKECCAIPFLSNTYRDYWGFRNESVLPNIKKVNTTFTKQYIEALNSLNINKREICKDLINEMLISLLNCEKIDVKNSQFLKTLLFFNANGTKERNETDREIKNKLLKNYEEIIITPNTSKSNHYDQMTLGYLDYTNFRFYQVICKDVVERHPTIKGKEKIIKTTFKIKSYRNDTPITIMPSSF
nr:hypothetical protein [uncultured Flavobacterium sp.]